LCCLAGYRKKGKKRRNEKTKILKKEKRKKGKKEKRKKGKKEKKQMPRLGFELTEQSLVQDNGLPL
jgi:hypothetical protein